MVLTCLLSMVKLILEESNKNYRVMETILKCFTLMRMVMFKDKKKFSMLVLPVDTDLFLDFTF